MNPAELMVTAGDVPILKSFFYARQSTGSGLPTSTGMAKGVSTFANAMQLTKHILKSAWCMCLSPRIKPYRLHCAQRSVSASTPPPRNGLVPTYDIKVICWFDKIGSRSCHMRFPALFSGNIYIFFVLFFIMLTSQSTWARYMQY